MITTETAQALDKLTDKTVIKHYLQNGLKNKIELENLLFALSEPKVSTKVNCGKNHITPFKFLTDILLENIKNFIVWANRSGSKSYLAGLITWFKSANKNLHETCILGGSESQSEKSYKAMGDFWRISELQEKLLKKEPMITKTEWLNGSVVSILTASQRSVRGPHPQFLILDEVDEMDFDIFEAALSQPQSKYDIPASIGIFSTNHNIDGTMDKALMIAEKGGFKLYKYCVWECLESCRDYKCSTCKLHSICPGKQMKEADGYYKISDFINKLEQLSWDTLQREWLCEKVGRGDLVYQAEYSEDVHLVNVAFNLNKEVILSIDWGGVRPFSVGAWQMFEDLGWIRIDEVYMGNTTNQLLIKECKAKAWWKNVTEATADPSRADLISEWRAEKTEFALDGIQVIEAINDVDEGIEAVKAALKPVLGNPKFFVNRICKDWRREVLSYKVKNNKIVKENDHAMDETRYFVMYKIKGLQVGEILMADWDTRPGR